MHSSCHQHKCPGTSNKASLLGSTKEPCAARVRQAAPYGLGNPSYTPQHWIHTPERQLKDIATPCLNRQHRARTGVWKCSDPLAEGMCAY